MTASQSVEVPWVDAWIRWERNSKQEDNSTDNPESSDSDDVDNASLPPPTESYTFTYTTPDSNIRITLKLDGYHYDSEQTWNSTGLTLWRSSYYLCQYLVDHSVEWMPSHDNTSDNGLSVEKEVKILEVGSGLGRCGMLAHLLSKASGYITKTLLTDGDTDTLKQLRQNLFHNIKNDDSIESRQLLWGKEYAMQYLQQQSTERKKFDLIIGSDLLYVPSVIKPLFETVLQLLSPDNGEFLMAHCCRRVGNEVSLEEVLSVANNLGFDCEEKMRNDEDIVLFSFTVNA